MTRRVTLLAQASCLGLAACASPPPARAPVPVSPIALEIRSLYDSAFAMVVAALPSESGNDASPIRQLRALVAFKSQSVGWATLDGNRYIALERGRRAGGWLAVVPPGNDALRAMQESVQPDPSPVVHVLQIKPERVSQVWAGILLVHHLSHLQDAVTGAGGPTGREQILRGEVRAYWRQLAAADLLARGGLRPALDTLLDRWRPSSIVALADLAHSLHLVDVNFLNQTLGDSATISSSELHERGSFFAAVLLIRYTERNSISLDELLQGLDRLVAAGSRSLEPWRDA